MAYLSREDIERIAEPIIAQYKQAFVPEYHLCYNVNPVQLASLLGYQIEYAYITKDGSILGQTSSGQIWTTVYDAGMNEYFFLLDGHTILIESRLLSSPRNTGRKNFTIAHKQAHQVINRLFPNVYGQQNQPSVTTAVPTSRLLTGMNGKRMPLTSPCSFPRMRFGMLCSSVVSGRKCACSVVNIQKPIIIASGDMANYLQVSRTAQPTVWNSLGYWNGIC